MKTFVLTISMVFPTTHKRSGEPTFFKEQILTAQMDHEKGHGLKEKIHTIRANYELWKNRIDQVKKGEAVLSLRYWSGKPYNSKQVEFCRLDKYSGIGVQQIIFDKDEVLKPFIKDSNTFIDRSELSNNDGLSLPDFKEWFKKYDLSKPMAIIHFTDWRY